MATAEYSPLSTTPVTPGVPENNPEKKPLHRVRQVRLQQGVSLRSAARNMKSDVRTLRIQEQESSDLRLSELRRWQEALDVPLADLLEDNEAPLSAPVLERARMIRLMKTAMALRDLCEDEGQRRMAQMMVNQLIEVMPELREISAWHSYGQRRSLDEYGQVFERRLSDDMLRPDDGA